MNKEQDREKGLSGQAFASLKNEMQKNERPVSLAMIFGFWFQTNFSFMAFETASV